ncbi:hypothetical protein CEXT_417671 [Caerostris extrusa]|uniref:Uncharacterized protein n=1 Tax=Caerostris extrusa TaxID=172846 RepID=A0AAV4S3J6_CAEEX|nr:hypothetical protein CEXT_417671 [Caerostris extrusa]
MFPHLSRAEITISRLKYQSHLPSNCAEHHRRAMMANEAHKPPSPNSADVSGLRMALLLGKCGKVSPQIKMDRDHVIGEKRVGGCERILLSPGGVGKNKLRS